MQLSTFLKVLLVFTFAGPAAAAQSAPLTLSGAVSIALEKNPAKKLAAADLASASAGVDLARSGFMPRISFSETATRGNDPVYAFGTRLRQGRFSAGDFALDRLNYPDPISNFSSRIGGEWNLFNSFQSRYQFRSARASRDVAQQSLASANAVVESSSAKVQAGTAVEADALAAKVTFATRQQELIRAKG